MLLFKDLSIELPALLMRMRSTFQKSDINEIKVKAKVSIWVGLVVSSK